VLHKKRNPSFYLDDNLRARMLSLETLAMELINPGIKARNEKLSKNNYQGIQGSILKAIENAGEMIMKKVSNSNDHITKLERKQRCHNCILENKSNNTSYRVCCYKCEKAICPSHSLNICKKCKNE
jgi:hypothetical protein